MTNRRSYSTWQLARAALAAAAFVLIASSCGGGTARLSAADFRTNAGGICSEEAVALEQLTNGAGSPVERLDRGLAIGNEALGRLRQLKPPKSLTVLVDRWLDLEASAFAQLKLARDHYAKGENATAKQFALAAKQFDARAGAVAGSLGLRPCQT